jgi:folate-dependent phosphoribosylglycinamide formyltransferase PurN
MRIGLTTFDFEDFDFQVQLNSLLREKIEPDFIILHYSGILNTGIRYLRFLLKTIRQYRLSSFPIFLKRIKKEKPSESSENSLNQIEKTRINSFLNRVRIIKVKGINDKSTIRKIRKLKNSIIICNSGILKEKVLSVPDVILLNIHAAKLPLYRGMNNVEWALYENKEIFVTVHRISRGIDEGDILYQEKVDIKEKNLSLITDYRKYCFFKSNEVIGKVLKKLINNKITFIPQERKHEPLLQYYVMHPILRRRLQEKLRT